MKKPIAFLIVVLAVAGIVLALYFCARAPERMEESAHETSETIGAIEHADSSDEAASEGEEEPGEEMAENESEEETDPDVARVDAFDALTDRWSEESKDGVKMADVDAFCKTFRNVPKDDRMDSIHRALNLIPDENVMLLAGVLMDKSVEREIVELVFNDILNRDEDVKRAILLQLYKDKSHPCWDDAAWVLEATK